MFHSQQQCPSSLEPIHPVAPQIVELGSRILKHIPSNIGPFDLTLINECTFSRLNIHFFVSTNWYIGSVFTLCSYHRVVKREFSMLANNNFCSTSCTYCYFYRICALFYNYARDNERSNWVTSLLKHMHKIAFKLQSVFTLTHY